MLFSIKKLMSSLRSQNYFFKLVGKKGFLLFCWFSLKFNTDFVKASEAVNKAISGVFNYLMIDSM
jgi:hypothetical protein